MKAIPILRLIPVLILTGAGQPLGPPPADLHLDPFYQKYVDAGGIPVVGSAEVPDKALQIARDIVNGELAYRPDLRSDLIARGARVGVMAVSENTMDMPEQRDWKKPACDDPRLTEGEREGYSRIAAMTDYEYWAERARGMGGLYTTAAAENLLGIPGTRYYGESILIHEFSHNILDSLRRVDRPLYAQIEAAFQNSRDGHLWDGDYASNTIDEYWAEGTQFWYDTNKISYRTERAVLSHDDLKKYDPLLYGALGAVYGRNHHITADVFHKSSVRITRKPATTGGPEAVVNPQVPSKPIFGFDIWPVSKGACVTKVISGSAAEKAGLRSGMVILKLDDMPLSGLNLGAMARILRAAPDELVLGIEGSGITTLHRSLVMPSVR